MKVSTSYLEENRFTEDMICSHVKAIYPTLNGCLQIMLSEVYDFNDNLKIIFDHLLWYSSKIYVLANVEFEEKVILDARIKDEENGVCCTGYMFEDKLNIILKFEIIS